MYAKAKIFILITSCLIVTFLITYYFTIRNGELYEKDQYNVIYTEPVKETEHPIDINGGGVKDALILETSDGSDSQTVVTYYAPNCVWETYKKDKDTVIYTTILKEVERHLIDINGDGVKDTLILEHDTLVSPQTFEHIKIKIANGGLYVVRCIDGYNIDTTTKINRNNLIDSDNIYVLEQTSNGIIMLVRDFYYGDCSTNFTIIQFHNGNFILNKIEDRVISSVSLSDSGDMITIHGYKYCEEKGETEKFHFPVVGMGVVGNENVIQHKNSQND